MNYCIFQLPVINNCTHLWITALFSYQWLTTAHIRELLHYSVTSDLFNYCVVQLPVINNCTHSWITALFTILPLSSKQTPLTWTQKDHNIWLWKSRSWAGVRFSSEWFTDKIFNQFISPITKILKPLQSILLIRLYLKHYWL
jgi:hypothetical protein